MIVLFVFKLISSSYWLATRKLS